MNGAAVHLALNHVPILGTVFAACLLAWGLARRSRDVVDAALLGFIASAVMAWPVYLSGPKAEALVQHLPGIVQAAIEEHEEAGEFALAALQGLGAMALVALVAWRGRERPRWFGPVMMVLALFVVSVVLRTGHLGGQIRHAEERSLVGAPDAPTRGGD